MPKPEFGFDHGTPQRPEEKWEQTLPDGPKVLYSKQRWREGFLYGCKCVHVDASIETSFETLEELNREQVEELPRFVDFIAGRRRGF
jgi:hypothetical protein